MHAPTQNKSDDTKNSFYKELEYVLEQFLKYHMKMLLGAFSAEVRREDIFKPTIRNESLHEISYSNGVTAINFATAENVIVKSTMFPHHSIHEYTWTSDGKHVVRLIMSR
jgi:hypothetical protein